MELVDIYNDKHEALGYTKGRGELEKGEFRLSCFVWILNSFNQLLIQQRVASAKKCPNMWETTSGGAQAGDNSLEGVVRELEEELGIKADRKRLKFIGSFARVNDFVEVYMLNQNFHINDLVLQDDEVQAVKWVSIEEFEEMIKEGIVSTTSYDVFKKYYDNYYNTYPEIIDGKVEFKKID